MDDETRLDNLFQRYRAACPDVEPSTDFMPVLWQRIEARHSFWFIFQQLARTVTTASAGLCLLLLVLNLVSSPDAHLIAPTYTDALIADHTAEKTYYLEAIRSTPSNDEAPIEVNH